MSKTSTAMLLVLLTFLFCIIKTPINVTYGNGATTKVYVDPPKIINPALIQNSTFLIDVKVENIAADPGLVGVEFKLTWKPEILSAVNMTEVLFHSTMPETEIEENLWRIKHIINNTEGSAWYAYTYRDIERAITGGYAPISGNHTIATIGLKVNGTGSTLLHFEFSKLGDPDANVILHETTDGFFKNTPTPPPAEIYVEPSRISDPTLVPCENFTINITIAEASDVHSLEFKLGFNSSILHVNSVERGEFIPPTAVPIIQIDNTAGYVKFNVTVSTPLSGNGTLAIITFHVEDLGRTTLDLYDTQLVDAFGDPLPHEASDGSFSNILLAKLAVQPQEIIDPALLPPSTFLINVTIADVEDLYGYEFNLTFDPSVLICLQVEIQDVLNETNYIPNQYINNIGGFIVVNVTYYPPANPLNIYPPTPLVTVKFRVKAIGASNLTLCNTKLVDSEGQPISHEVYHGFFQSLIRDIAVIDVYPFPTAVYERRETNITVTVKNEGNITETFSINVYYNATLFATVNVTNLAPNENATVIVAWDTDGVQPGYYKIKAEVPPVPYEIDTLDNVFINGLVKVKILGDINGDDVVDIYDALLAANSFGSSPGMSNWNPDADLKEDNIIDIFDIILLSGNFGRKI